jgi:Ni/Co efflux regulator RcnB
LIRQKALKEITMQKLILSLAALSALALVVPYAAPAKAEDKVIIHKHHGDMDRDRNYHHHHKVVIIKHPHHDHD